MTVEIGTLITRTPLPALATDSLAKTARNMTKEQVGSAIVMTDEGHGIITERDILRAVAAGANLETTQVAEYMTQNAITAFHNWSVREAAEKMAGGHFRHLIVINEQGQMEGVLSIRDVLRGLLSI